LGVPARSTSRETTPRESTFGAEDIEFGLQNIQDHICQFLFEHSEQTYTEDLYDYKVRGGGRTRVWEGHPGKNVLEKAGVNFSSIGGDTLPAATQAQIKMSAEDSAKGTPFKAMGVSLVIHPSNPHIPTIHMNIRYFETGPLDQPDKFWWFGGGIDLTPYWPTPGLFQRVINFHKKLREICQRHNQPYEKYKSTCDDYFTIPHRNEMRGVGGIFFDHLNAENEQGLSKRDLFAFISDLGFAFTAIYKPFIDIDRRTLPYNTSSLDVNFNGIIEENEREWQLVRRSRYVEFNLMYDRGTKFGLQSKGRVESILMSLPTIAKWKYNHVPKKGSAAEIICSFYLQPQPWVNLLPENAHLYEVPHTPKYDTVSPVFIGAVSLLAFFFIGAIMEEPLELIKSSTSKALEATQAVVPNTFH